MDPLALLAAMLHVQTERKLPLRDCVELAGAILQGAENEAALFRANEEAEAAAAQAVPITDKVM
jgi:hypothetical protein